MPWTSVTVELDFDKQATSEAGQLTAVWTYDVSPHVGKTFVYTERFDTGTRAGFVGRANAAKNANTQKINRENVLSTNMLATLQS